MYLPLQFSLKSWQWVTSNTRSFQVFMSVIGTDEGGGSGAFLILPCKCHFNNNPYPIRFQTFHLSIQCTVDFAHIRIEEGKNRPFLLNMLLQTSNHLVQSVWRVNVTICFANFKNKTWNLIILTFFIHFF